MEDLAGGCGRRLCRNGDGAVHRGQGRSRRTVSRASRRHVAPVDGHGDGGLLARAVGVELASLAPNAAPGRFVPCDVHQQAPFYFVGEWVLVVDGPSRRGAAGATSTSPASARCLVPGFWLIATERFDPHTAKLRFGQVAGSARSAAWRGACWPSAWPSFSAPPRCCRCWRCSSLLRAPGWCAGSVGSADAPRTCSRVMRQAGHRRPSLPSPDCASSPRAPYLRSLAALVCSARWAQRIVDYMFKAQAVATLGRGDGPAAASSRSTTRRQPGRRSSSRSSFSRSALERLGLAFVVSTPSLALHDRLDRRTAGAGPRERAGRARRRIGCFALALQSRLRALLHTDRARPKSGRRSRSSTSASTGWAKPSAAASCAWSSLRGTGDAAAGAVRSRHRVRPGAVAVASR